MSQPTEVKEKEPKVRARWIAWIIGPFIGFFTQTLPESWDQVWVFLVLATGVALVFIWSLIA